ncbi:hypothetical protein EIK77_002493, partial [Talaromyces pinophilus]
EFILLSDVLGLSLLVDSIDHPKPANSTEGTVLGPFHTHEAPSMSHGDRMSQDPNGEPLLVACTIKDREGNPISGVKVDIWETDSTGHYDVQYANRPGPDGRCVMHSDGKGEFWFKAIKPVPYPIPHDGPVGKLLKKLQRHPYRPSHMHFMFDKEGYDHLITSLYIRNDPYETSDAVFGVKNSLIVELDKVTFSSTQFIALYDILWAEISNNVISIDFVRHTSKSLMEPRKLSFPVASNGLQNHDGIFAGDFCRILLARAYREARSRKRAYVLINPNSGPGSAMRIWKNEVKPIFDAGRMELHVVNLTHGGQATELAEKIDLGKYDTIIACSGDGTLHEIFNGLGNRPDAGYALASMPVSHIPCGSGNAFSCNLYGSHRASVAALAIVKGIVAPIDLVSVTYGERRILSFLSQTVGITAESDLDTEHLRWMGSARFEFGVITRVFKQTCYPCDLALKVEIEDKQGIKAHYRRHASSTEDPGAAIREVAKANLAVGYDLPELKYGTVQDSIPESWKLICEDKMGTFFAGNMAYMSPKVNIFPASNMTDGLIDLITVNGDLSPVTALRVMSQTDSPTFFDNPHVKYRKISAYRITPRNQDDGCISIDGERIPFGPFQAEVHQGLGRVISKSSTYQADGPANWDKAMIAD